ncbi:MAG: metalloregulator ArsR/SmtB family transcription factor [Eubacteriales bacterium]
MSKEAHASVCGENCPNYQVINEIRMDKQHDFELIQELSDTFKVFSDHTRLRIICTILNNECTVSEICEALQMNRTTISHQLKVLRDTKLVKFRRDGRKVLYSLENPHIEQIILQAFDHIL